MTDLTALDTAYPPASIQFVGGEFPCGTNANVGKLSATPSGTGLPTPSFSRNCEYFSLSKGSRLALAMVISPDLSRNQYASGVWQVLALLSSCLVIASAS